MPAIRDLTDLLATTLEDMPRGDYEETLGRRDVPLARTFFHGRKVSKSGGFAMKDRIRVRASTSARFVRPYQGRGASQQNYMVSIATDWVTFVDDMLFNEIEDDLNSGDSTQLVDLMKVRRSGTYEGIYDLIEASLAREPISASDDLNLWGIPLWLRRVTAVDTEGGFNGVTVRYRDGTTATTVGASSSAPDANDPANARLRNWAATYGGVFDTTCFRTVRRAKRRTQFRSAADLKGTLDRGGRQILLMPEDQCEQYEDLANAGPDNNEGDLTKHGKYRIDGLDAIPVPEFNTLAYLPIYGIKLGHVEGNIMKQRWMREGKPMQDPDDSFTYKIPVSGTCNLRFRNIRHGGFAVTYA
jgi:hypothetical protein